MDCVTLTEKYFQKLLLEAIRDNDTEKIEDLFTNNELKANYVHDYVPHCLRWENKTTLQIVCAFPDKIETTALKCVQLLLLRNADVFYEEQYDKKKTAVHYAAQGGNKTILKTLLEHLRTNNSLHNDKLNNIFLTLVLYIRNYNKVEAHYKDIFKLLFEIGIDINIPDITSGWTAIYAAVKYEFKEIILWILQNKFEEINLDNFEDDSKKSARNLILDYDLYQGDLPERIDESSNITIHTLYKNIRQHQTDEFKDHFDGLQDNLNEKNKYTLLYIAVDRHALELVQYLLDRGIDINAMPVDNNPLILASRRGYHQIVTIFRMKNPNSELVSKSLFQLTKASYTNIKNETIDYEKCVKQLLSYENLKINSPDSNSNTALHFAVKYQSPEMALEILDKGASMACRDAYGKLPTEDMDSELLERHLNNCISNDKEELPLSNRKILINFTSLLPPRKCTVREKTESTKINVNPEEKFSINNTNECLPETEVLQLIGNSTELKHLLKHPVILAFLYLKWHRIRMFFYINLAFYMLFVASLITYITAIYNKKSETENTVVAKISFVLLIITFVVIVIRELFQIVIYRSRYFEIFDNCLELVLLAVTTGILIDKSNESSIRQLSAIAIVASAIEFLLLVGQFPSMSTNIMMLRTVSWSIFKLLLWCFIPLLAFAYSFHILFQTETNSDSGTSEQDGEPNFFDSMGKSLLKTIVMSMGEFETTTLNFDSYSISSYIVFVTFLFFMAIVLFNLLTGLAVSDTDTIINDAELYVQILRVEHIAHVERILLTKTVKWLPIVHQICMFPLNIYNKSKVKIIVVPNQDNRVYLTESQNGQNEIYEQKCYKLRSAIYLDKKVLRAITKTLKENKTTN